MDTTFAQMGQLGVSPGTKERGTRLPKCHKMFKHPEHHILQGRMGPWKQISIEFPVSQATSLVPWPLRRQRTCVATSPVAIDPSVNSSGYDVQPIAFETAFLRISLMSRCERAGCVVDRV